MVNIFLISCFRPLHSSYSGNEPNILVFSISSQPLMAEGTHSRQAEEAHWLAENSSLCKWSTYLLLGPWSLIFGINSLRCYFVSLLLLLRRTRRWRLHHCSHQPSRLKILWLQPCIPRLLHLLLLIIHSPSYLLLSTDTAGTSNYLNDVSSLTFHASPDMTRTGACYNVTNFSFFTIFLNTRR